MTDHDPSTNINIVDTIENDTVFNVGTKMHYKSLIHQKSEKPKSEDRLQKRLNIYNIDFGQVYTSKIKHIKDLKLAEFNYKVLHNKLPCNKNLKKWDKQIDDACDVCNDVQDICHLLYECKFNAKIWNLLGSVLNCNITMAQIIIGDQAHSQNLLTSLLSFYIYKYWLICKNDKKPRVWKDVRVFIISELNYRREVYKLTKLKENCGAIERLKQAFIQCVI